ncbi:MAG: hypothetical protein JXR37_10245 [Kiritimatiellae bacterium]|nr:hypothetical protein [Kiritimatiellia bacterium]
MERVIADFSSIETELDSFDAEKRRAVLTRLARTATGALATVPAANVNMHMHSFFSYNAAGHSPSHLAWQAFDSALYAAGLCDFDVLDGLSEFLAAGLLLRLRATVNLETRAYLKEFAGLEINSPGEPGVTYLMGAGFCRPVDPDTREGQTLSSFKEQAALRNKALVARINAQLEAGALDYEADVLPLTPAGYATERHIVKAYIRKTSAVQAKPKAFESFWAQTLKSKPAEVEALQKDPVAFEEKVRARLVKQGGLGYEEPTPAAFPKADDFMAWVKSCRAIPMATWLDGTSKGESDGRKMLECLQAKGAAALNIIPDRNWNIEDSKIRALKLRKLGDIVGIAREMQMPLSIGTEMNKDGQPPFDDLSGEALRPYAPAFLDGARVLVGHGWLSRYADFPYTGEAAAAEFGRDLAAKNAFFAATGKLPPVDQRVAKRLEDLGPERALGYIRESVRVGRWATRYRRQAADANAGNQET